MVLGITGLEGVIFVLILFVFLATGATFMGRKMYYARWPIQVTLLEEIAPNQTKIVGRDRARRIAITETGEDIMILRNANVYRVSHGHYIGDKAMAWAKSKRDGYWYNVKLGNIDKKLLELGVVPTSRTSRLEHTAMRKLVAGKFLNKDFMEKYGSTISILLIIVAVIILVGGQIYMQVQNLKVKSIDKETAEVYNKAFTKIDALLEKIDKENNVLTTNNNSGNGASGLVPIP